MIQAHAVSLINDSSHCINDLDITFAFLQALKNGNQIGDADASFTETYLFHILNDLIFAGTETMSSTIRWAILYMIVHVSNCCVDVKSEDRFMKIFVGENHRQNVISY